MVEIKIVRQARYLHLTIYEVAHALTLKFGVKTHVPYRWVSQLFWYAIVIRRQETELNFRETFEYGVLVDMRFNDGWRLWESIRMGKDQLIYIGIQLDRNFGIYHFLDTRLNKKVFVRCSHKIKYTKVRWCCQTCFSFWLKLSQKVGRKNQKAGISRCKYSEYQTSRHGWILWSFNGRRIET